MTEVKLRGVGVDYKSLGRMATAIDGIDLEVSAGDALSVIGPSGCGKSTLLYALSGLISPSRGSIKINGGELSGQRRETALILQDYGLFPWNTVFDNAALGLRVRHIPKEETKEEVKRILSRLGLWDMRDRYPAQLSGGQRQRVAIARSLALNPDLLLMDEPFSSLDALTREELQNTVLEIWRERNINSKNDPGGQVVKPLTIVLVTHSIEEAAFLGERIAVMGMGPGRIIKLVGNKGMGDVEYRNTSTFYNRCVELRSLLKEGAREVVRVE